MSTDILQQFLRCRLFEIGPDDDRLERLRAAAADMAAEIVANRSRTVKYASVAFDPEIPSSEPALADVASRVEAQWNTYLSCFADTPRVLYRAVLLEALRQAMKKDARIALALTLVSRNLVPHLNVAAEFDAWKGLLDEAAERVETQADAEWSGDKLLPTIEHELPKVIFKTALQPAKVDRSQLLAAMEAASGPSSNRGTALKTPNPHWPNAASNWSYEFAPRAAAGIADSLDDTLQKTFASQDLNALLTAPLVELVRAVDGTFRKAIECLDQASLGLRRRTGLLWWKEALFSSSANLSYRMLPTDVAALLMATDLSHQVPEFCPVSVEFFLRETVASVVPASIETGPEPVMDIFARLVEAAVPKPLRDFLATCRSQTEGRRPLVALLADYLEAGRVEPGGFRAAVGIEATTAMDVPELSVWFFREIQAMRATT